MKRHILKQHPHVIRNERELKIQFQYPALKAPLPYLPVCRDGLGCDETIDTQGQRCRYVCRDVTAMKKHYRLDHGWVNHRGRGGSIIQRQNIVRPWRENIPCQRLFHHAPQNGYWEVKIDQEETEFTIPSSISSMPSTQAEIAERMLAEIKQKEAAIREREDRVHPGVKLDANPWLDRVGWAEEL